MSLKSFLSLARLTSLRRRGSGPTETTRMVLASRPGFLLCLVLCLICDFYLARSSYPNSDSVQSYNEMLAIRAGNLLLHNWALATDNFLLTDLPAFMLTSFILGPGPRLIYLVPFFVFVLFLAACLLLIKEVATSRRDRVLGGYVVLMLLGVPYGLHYNFFFWSDFHIATLTICLYAVLLVSPTLSSRRFNKVRLIPFATTVFAVAFSDPLADGLLLGPLVFLVILRAWLGRRLRVDDWLIVGCVLLGLAASTIALRRLSQAGSFSTVPSLSTSFVGSIADLGRNLHALLAGAQVLFTARASLITFLPLHEMISLSRLTVASLVIVLCCTITWRMPTAPHKGVAQLLVSGAMSLAVLAAMSATFEEAVTTGVDYPGAAIRFVVPMFVFLCVAASIEAGSLVFRCRPMAVRLLIAFGVVAGVLYAVGSIATVGSAIHDPIAVRAVPQRLLADWLQRQGLVYGVGDYWDTQMVLALSAGKVIADPVIQIRGRLDIFTWLTDTTRFKAKRQPQFVIITPGSKFGVTLEAAEATYGPPSSITNVAGRYFVARFKAQPH